LYSAPTEYEGLHLWYNATMFQKYGWTPPATYEELVSLCKDIQGHGVLPFAAGFSDCKACWEWWHTYAFNATLGTKALYQVLTGEQPWTIPECATALEKLKALWDQDFIAKKQADALSGNSSLALWGQQKAAMYLQGTWGFSTVDQYAKGWDYGVARLPMWSSEPAAIPIGIGEVDAINPSSKYLDAAEQLLDYITAPPSSQAAGQIIANIKSVWIPCVAIQASDLPAGTDPRFSKTLVELQTAMQDGSAGYVAWSAWPSKTESYMWENLDSVLLGQLSIPSFLSQAQQVFAKEKSSGDLPTVPKPLGV
ncbi:MAG: ABC transporter substrate-binding protein, partial [Candidatus Dormiibacterota bacterium]